MNEIYKHICICAGSVVYMCVGVEWSQLEARSGSIAARCCPLKDPSLERVCGFSLGVPRDPSAVLHIRNITAHTSNF
jgi:hypothetical protein